jgi:glycosyltransferase involved in cell wall biosynthesis
VRVMFMQSQIWFGADSGIQALLLRNFDRRVVQPYVALNRVPFEEDPDLDAGRRFRAIPDLTVRPTTFGPSIDQLGLFDKVKQVPSLAAMPDSLLSLAAYIRRHKIQVVHGTEKPRDAFYGVIAARLGGAKSIVHLHVKHDDWMRGMVNWALKNADGIVGVSPFVAQSAIDAGYPAGKVFHVVNALDLSGSKWDPAIDGGPARQSLGVGPDELLIGITARLFPWKGHRFLLDALAIVRQQFPNVRLAVVGEDDPRATPGGGSFLAELKEQARSLGLDRNVIFTGFRKDIPELLAAFDVFALPTWEEPCAVAFLEAMAMAKPVVAWQSGGTPEMVVHGQTGLLVEPNSAPLLADALLEVLRDPELRRRFGAAGRKRVVERLNPRRMCQDMVEVYRHLLGEAPASANVQRHLYPTTLAG